VNRVLFAVSALAVVASACSRTDTTLGCPTTAAAQAAVHDSALPMESETATKSMGQLETRNRLTCFFIVETKWGESGRATTRLVLWDAVRGLDGWYSLPGVQLTTIGPGRFEYTDSEGATQTLDLSTNTMRDELWIDGEIVHFTPTKQH